MPHSTFEKFLPAAGMLAGILFAISGYVAHTPENASDNPVTAMAGHETQNFIALVAAALFAVTMAFFAVAHPAGPPIGRARRVDVLQRRLRRRRHGRHGLGAQRLGHDRPDRRGRQQGRPRPRASSAPLGIDSWLPFMAAAAVLLLSTGLGGLRTAVLPKWLSIVTVVLGVCCLGGPTGFARLVRDAGVVHRHERGAGPAPVGGSSAPRTRQTVSA